MSSEDDIVLHSSKQRPGRPHFNSDDEDFPDLAELDIGTSDTAESDAGSSPEDRRQQREGSDFGSDLSDVSDVDSSEEIVPFDFKNLPSHACKYCGIHDPGCVVRCSGCNRWFCNGKAPGNAGSHIVQHLVRAKHREIALHPDSAVGDSVLECYHCGNRNIFLLGFIPAKTDTVVVLLCRQPCASGAGSAKDATWDLENWTPLINQRALLSWLVNFPSERMQLCARPISAEQIVMLEELWKTRPEADLDDLKVTPILELPTEHVRLRYDSAEDYRSVMAPLVTLEAEQDKATKEAQKQESVSIRWDVGLNMKRIAWIMLPASRDADFRVAPGDEVRITHCASKWRGTGNIIKTAVSMPFSLLVTYLPNRWCSLVRGGCRGDAVIFGAPLGYHGIHGRVCVEADVV